MCKIKKKIAEKFANEELYENDVNEIIFDLKSVSDNTNRQRQTKIMKLKMGKTLGSTNELNSYHLDPIIILNKLEYGELPGYCQYITVIYIRKVTMPIYLKVGYKCCTFNSRYKVFEWCACPSNFEIWFYS